MPEIGTSGSMSGDGKRGVGHRPQATVPILDSTKCDIVALRRPMVSGLAGFGTLAHNHLQLRADGSLKSKQFQRPDPIR
jgi:hypothetical protein